LTLSELKAMAKDKGVGLFNYEKRWIT
jgi:hypothetical protein